MSQPRFLADEDFRGDILAAVRRTEPALDFSTVQDHGLRAAADAVILAFAAQHDLIIVSHDRNTMTAAAYERLHRGEQFPGLFIVEQEARIGPVLSFLVLTWAASDSVEWINVVEYLPS